MKILKTSKQAKEEKLARDAAIQEMEECPECGNRTKWSDLIGYDHRFFARCRRCGCEWESSEF
jgi:hypothetical protein